jgi:hypothetical protein
MSAEYRVHFEVEAQAQEKKIKEQLIALGWTAPRHAQVNSNNKGRSMGALSKQTGGSHYQLAIQPIEYIYKNSLDYCEGNVVKYITRHGSKNGAEDIRKAIHYCELLLELEYGEES